MTGWIVALCVLVLLAIILLLRVGICVEYGQRFVLGLRIGPGNVQIYPAKRTSLKKRNKQKHVSQKRGENLELIRVLLPLVLRTLKRVCGKLQVDKLDMVISLCPESFNISTACWYKTSALFLRTGRQENPAWQNRQPRMHPRNTSRFARSWTISVDGTIIFAILVIKNITTPQIRIKNFLFLTSVGETMGVFIKRFLFLDGKCFII